MPQSRPLPAPTSVLECFASRFAVLRSHWFTGASVYRLRTHPFTNRSHGHPTRAALPNPSVNRSANGRPPGPVCGPLHSPQPGPGVLPSSPGYLQR